MLTRIQAQKAIDLLGKPKFTNARKGYRTWKWYMGLEAQKKLARAGISCRYCPAPEHMHWQPSSVTVYVPETFLARKFKGLKVVKPKKLSTNELRSDLKKAIDGMIRSDLLSLHKLWC